jgi:hypothetical protein
VITRDAHIPAPPGASLWVLAAFDQIQRFLAALLTGDKIFDAVTYLHSSDQSASEIVGKFLVKIIFALLAMTLCSY